MELENILALIDEAVKEKDTAVTHASVNYSTEYEAQGKIKGKRLDVHITVTLPA